MEKEILIRLTTHKGLWPLGAMTVEVKTTADKVKGTFAWWVALQDELLTTHAEQMEKALERIGQRMSQINAQRGSAPSGSRNPDDYASDGEKKRLYATARELGVPAEEVWRLASERDIYIKRATSGQILELINEVRNLGPQPKRPPAGPPTPDEMQKPAARKTYDEIPF